MAFTIRELMNTILESDIDNERKAILLEGLCTKGRISEGLYLKRSQGNYDEFECWFRNEDEYGQTEHGNTYFGPEEIVDEFDRITIPKKR